MINKKAINKITANKRLPRFTRRELFERANATDDFGESLYNDTIVDMYDLAREEGIRLAVAFFRDTIGDNMNTDMIVDMVLQAYDDALQGSL